MKMQYKIIILLFLLFRLLTIHPQLLTDINKAVTNLPEFPVSDDLNWVDPEYSTFHHSLVPNTFVHYLQQWHLWPKPFFNLNRLKQLLQEVADQRIALDLDQKHIVTIGCDHSCQLYIWGDLHASLHSFVRDLNFLVKKGVIDNNLRIKNPNHFFVFNGDAINRGVYSIETLIMILLLMKQNPQQIFYNRGNQEKEEYWKNFSLKRELKIRGGLLSRENIPLESWVNDFFHTLPDVIYITTPQHPHNPILLTFPGITNINDPLMNISYIESYKSGIHYFSKIPTHTSQIHKKGININVQAIIKTERWVQSNRVGHGLGLLDQSLGATCWTVFSSPNPVHKDLYNFHWDAFVLLEIKPNIKESTIQLFNRPLSMPADTFIEHTPLNVITGRPISQPTPAPQGKDIILGSSMSLTQGIPVVGQRVKQGVDVAINECNRNGGINGRHIRLFIKEDSFTPHIARQNINYFIENNITMLIAPLGDQTLAAYRDYLIEDKILAIFPVAGGPQFRKPDLKGVVHVSATYADGVSAMINHLITEYASTNFAFFYQNDDYGVGPVTAAKKVLEQHNITKTIDIPYTRGNITFADQVKKLNESQADAVGFFSTSHATAEYIRQLNIETLANKSLLGTFLLGDASFRNFMQRRGVSIIMGSRVPNPFKSDLPIVKEYRNAMDGYKYPYDIFSLEGYLATRLLIDLMQKMKGEINHITVRKAIEDLKDYEFGGFTYTFDPNTRSLARYIWISSDYDKEWIRITIDPNLITQNNLLPQKKSNGVPITVTSDNKPTPAPTPSTPPPGTPTTPPPTPQTPQTKQKLANANTPATSTIYQPR